MMWSRVAAVTAVLLTGISRLALGQSADSTFSDLRRDGNRIPALAATISTAFGDISAASALRAIAVSSRIGLTFESSLPGLSKTVIILPHDRTVAAAILEITEPIGLRARVSTTGTVIVVASPPPPNLRR